MLLPPAFSLVPTANIEITFAYPLDQVIYFEFKTCPEWLAATEMYSL